MPARHCSLRLLPCRWALLAAHWLLQGLTSLALPLLPRTNGCSDEEYAVLQYAATHDIDGPGLAQVGPHMLPPWLGNLPAVLGHRLG